MKSARFFTLAFLIFIFSFSTFSYADVPSMINYQGKITTPTGALVDTSVQMTFTIYDDSTTGNVLWADTLSSVSVEKGIFSVLLGSSNPIPDSVFDGNVRYLGTKVGTDAEMIPRKAMVSVAYAYRAGTADGGNGGGGGWVDDGTVVRLETSTDRVGIGTTSPTGELEVRKDYGSGTCIKINNAMAGEYAGEWVYFYEDWDITSGIGHTNSAHTMGEMVEIATYRNIPMIFRTNDNERLRIAAGGEIGIGVTSPGDKLDVNGDIRVRGADITDAGGTSRITLTDDGRLDLKEDNGSSALSIATNGYVGMGTTSPDRRLTLTGDADTTDACIHLDAFWNPEIFFDAGASQADGKIHFQTSGTEKWTFYHDGSENSIKFNNSGTGTVLYLASSGRIGIGTTSPSYTLDVNGDINIAGSYNVKKAGVNYTHPDYVFEKNYELMPLEELEKYVSENKCLPNVISAEDVKRNNGFKMDELLIQMLEKIEEQTLYILQLEKRISELEKSQ